jgi:hypothetical protein
MTCTQTSIKVIKETRVIDTLIKIQAQSGSNPVVRNNTRTYCHIEIEHNI